MSVLLILDDVRAYEEGDFEWLLHYQGEARQGDNSITLVSGERSQALVQPLFPEEIVVREKTGLQDHKPDVEVPYLAFAPAEPTRTTKFLTAVLPVDPRGQTPLPMLERLRGDEMIGVRIRRDSTITDVYVNLRADGRKMHRNSCHTIDGWETDAYCFAVTRAIDADANSIDAVQRIFVAGGSYLRRDGTVVLASLSKVFCVFTPGRPDVRIALQGQPMTNVSLRAVQPPQSVTINGTILPTRYDRSAKMIRIQMAAERPDRKN